MRAITEPTFTPLLPSATKIFANMPEASASRSTMALSVSISAMISPISTGSPSFLCQRASVPSVMEVDTAGMQTSIDMILSL
jgi:hypothetical protein